MIIFVIFVQQNKKTVTVDLMDGDALSKFILLLS